MYCQHTHKCLVCGHKMSSSDVLYFHGEVQCPNCYAWDMVVSMDSGINSPMDVVQQVINTLKKNQ